MTHQLNYVDILRLKSQSSRVFIIFTDNFSDFYKNYLPRIYYNNPTVTFRCSPVIDGGESRIELLYSDRESPIILCLENNTLNNEENKGEIVAKAFLNQITKLKE